MFKVGDRVRVIELGTIARHGEKATILKMENDVQAFLQFDGGAQSFYPVEWLSLIENPSFFMLLVDGTETAKKRHATIEAARQEASRLLNLPDTKGKGITILKAVEQGKLPEVGIEWKEVSQ